jgi:hypothetical protein
MNLDIAIDLDSLIDFGQYDGDNDGKADYFAVFNWRPRMNNPDPYYSQNWFGISVLIFPSSYTYQTSDSNSIGNPVIIDGYGNAHTQRAMFWHLDWYDGNAAVFAHEYCHPFAKDFTQFLNTARPRLVAVDPYPFKGKSYTASADNCYDGWETGYAGSSWSSHWGGLQNMLNWITTAESSPASLDKLRRAIKNNPRADSIDLWYWAQMPSSGDQ